MHRTDNTLTLAPTDLAKHLACPHLTQLDRAVAEGRLVLPAWSNPNLELLRQRGLEHEAAYIAHLEASGLTVANHTDHTDRDSSRTLDAMQRGFNVIVQPELASGRWYGRADVLLRIDVPSALGEWSYEAIDTKLAQETRAGTILQLCLYSEIIAALQGLNPELMHVVKPGDDLPRETFRCDDFQAYFRYVKARLEAAVDAEVPPDTYPTPVPHCDICMWWQECDARRRADDHLCLVAGLGSLHIDEINRQGATTLEQFALRAQPLTEPPSRGSLDAFEKAHHQAQVQLRGRQQNAPVHDLLPPDPSFGLSRLPTPSRGDVFFDIESDPFVDGGGLEYLLGFSYLSDDGSPEYKALWAFDRQAERREFEHAIDFLSARLEQYPDLHVYHFSPYEPIAMKRLMGRYGTRGPELDRLLRAERFVDLHAITRQGVRASVERYSLKDLEPFFGFDRSLPLAEANSARRRVDCLLELELSHEIVDDDRQAVELYNKEDCLSTQALRDWLEDCRAELVSQGHAIDRPELKTGHASDAVDQRDEETQQLFDQLAADIPDDPTERTEEQHARWILAHLLEYFRREAKSAWWEYFHINDLEPDDLLDERKALHGLQFSTRDGGTDRCPIHRYSFPPQEVAFRVEDQLDEIQGNPIGTVVSTDPVGCTIDIKKRRDSADHHPSSILARPFAKSSPLDTSLIALARSVLQSGMDGAGPFRATRDLLLHKPPRFRGSEAETLRRDAESASDSALRLAIELDHGTLPIQGPPGTGKTYTGAHLILALLREGKRIGVSAVSHKAIQNLLKAVLEQSNDDIEVVHKTKPTDDDVPGLVETNDSDEIRAALNDGKVIGATAWLWAADDMAESLDYLFVDEAGQMSLAHTLAAGRAARNIVLLGDPQQLKQPQRGAHPEGTEVSALDHILQGEQTISDSAGLLLDETRRLHPDICEFTSEVYYEQKLNAHESSAQQRVIGDTRFVGTGLFHVPVVHEGNQSSAPEEVDAVERCVQDLLQPGTQWINQRGETLALTADDILVVAPYNAQVSALAQRLHDLRVGTVDKFQGQEAPVVIYSATSSSAQDAPRGMSFLYEPNRLNVATSRARCVCIVVATQALFEPECRTPDQMRWANGLCRYRELATEVEP